MRRPSRRPRGRPGVPCDRRGRYAWGLSVVLAVLAVAACADEKSAPKTATRPTALRSTTSTSTALPAAPSTTQATDPNLTPEQQEVADAYRAAIKAYYDAASIPDPHDPGLIATHVGRMLMVNQLRIEELLRLGRSVVVKSEQPYSVTIVRVERTGDGAVLEGCLVDRGVVIDRRSNRVVDERVVTDLDIVTMERSSGSWKLAGRRLQKEAIGVVPCPV